MDEVARGLPFHFLVARQHMDHLRTLCKSLEGFDIVINMQKREFSILVVIFLGYRIDSTGTCPLQKKVQVLLDFPQPTTRQKLQKFFGLSNFYHHIIPDCTTILQLLHDLLSTDWKMLCCNGRQKC